MSPVPGGLQDGDVATVYVDGSDVGTATYSHEPTITPGACGDTTITGTTGPYTDIEATTNTGGSVTGTVSGDTYSASLPAPLSTDDGVDIQGVLTTTGPLGNEIIVFSNLETYNPCTQPTPPTTPAPPPTTPPPPTTGGQNDLSLSLGGPGSIGSEGLTKYRLTIDNHSSLPAAGVVVKGNLPRDIVPATRPRIGNSLCTTGRQFVCRLGTLHAGDYKTIALSLRAQGSLQGLIALTRMTISSTTPDADLSDNVTQVRQQIPASRPSVGLSHSTHQAFAASVAAGFSALSWNPYCGGVGSGAAGEGTAGALLKLAEFGKSGTTHFTLEWELQEENELGGWNWAGGWQTGVVEFPDDSNSYHLYFNHYFSLSDDGATYRLQVRGKWIHDRRFLPDKVLKDTGWWVAARCVGSG